MRTQDRSRATKRISLEDMMEYSAIIDGDWIYENPGPRSEYEATVLIEHTMGQLPAIQVRDIW